MQIVVNRHGLEPKRADFYQGDSTSDKPTAAS